MIETDVISENFSREGKDAIVEPGSGEVSPPELQN